MFTLVQIINTHFLLPLLKGSIHYVKSETLDRMFTPVWTYDPALKNGNTYGGLNHCYGMAFDRKQGNGLVYFIAGTGNDMGEYPGRYSAFYCLEEALFTAGAEFAQFDY